MSKSKRQNSASMIKCCKIERENEMIKYDAQRMKEMGFNEEREWICREALCKEKDKELQQSC